MSRKAFPAAVLVSIGCSVAFRLGSLGLYGANTPDLRRPEDNPPSRAILVPKRKTPLRPASRRAAIFDGCG
jgi:hypothetical protein